MTSRPIYVTRPLLPALEEFIPYLEQIWAEEWVTNGGTFHQRFEARLAEYLGVPQVSLFANGTLALIAALRVLGLRGEVITTPFSFVATAHALSWSGIRPVFADIEPDTLTIDPARIEAAITERTAAILPVHTYGYPCRTEEIGAIAHRHGLNVVYDAAHAFGIQDARGSLLRHGDLSILSFHATKSFHTFEGGAVISHSANLKTRIDQAKNFGFVNETAVESVGINAKMNELQAAFGLLQLDHFEDARQRRQEIAQLYREHLSAMPFLETLRPPEAYAFNYGYFPVFVHPASPVSRDALVHELRSRKVMVRRYFSPLISEFSVYRGEPSAAPELLPNATRAAASVVCLPISPNMTDAEVEVVVSAIEKIMSGQSSR